MLRVRVLAGGSGDGEPEEHQSQSHAQADPAERGGKNTHRSLNRTPLDGPLTVFTSLWTEIVPGSSPRLPERRPRQEGRDAAEDRRLPAVLPDAAGLKRSETFQKEWLN